MRNKRIFGFFEVIVDIGYLAAALVLGGYFLITDGDAVRNLAGSMALVLVFGDSFHLIPRIALFFTGNEEKLRAALGTGKQIASVTMTVFYLLLWHAGLGLFPSARGTEWSAAVYLLAAGRIALCLPPQNKWRDRYPPVRWGVIRNAPFFLQGFLTGVLFFSNRNVIPGLGAMWLAIFLSFAFYLPVVLWSNKYPPLGMLMMPEIGAYLWILALFYAL